MDQEEGEFSSPDIHTSSSDAHSSPRRLKRLQEKCSSSPAPVLTSSGSSRRCSGCIDNRQRTLKTRSISPPGGSPSSISSGHPLPLEPPPSSCAPSCFSLSSSVAGLGRRTFGGRRDHIPSSWMSYAAEQTPFRACPGSARPSAPSSVPDKWLCTPNGWTSVPEAYHLPASSQYGLPQFPYPQFPPVVYHGGHHTFSQCGFPGCGRDYHGRSEPLPYRSLAQLEFREPRFTELDSASNTLEPRAPRDPDYVRETPREAPRPVPLEPSSAFRCRSSHPQPRPRARRASDSDTFVTPVAVHFYEEGIATIERPEDRQGQARTGVYSD